MPLPPLTVLIVEDDRSIARMLQLALHHYGAQPTVVETGAAALQRLASSAYAVLLTDYGLPDMTGVMLIQQVQQLLAPAPRLILMSGHPQALVAPQLRSIGMPIYLAKPFPIPALYHALNQCQPDPTLVVPIARAS